MTESQAELDKIKALLSGESSDGKKLKKASEYTVADVFRIIDSNDVKHLIHMSASTAGIKDEFQFVAQISEFIYARSLEKLPTTLEMLNRKFGRIASKLGTSARSAVDFLLN